MTVCDCEYPLAQLLGDELRNPKPDAEGRYHVTRYCDCLLCGPSCERLWVYPAGFINGQPQIAQIFEPFHVKLFSFRKRRQALNAT